MNANRPENWNSVSRALHWLIALLILFQLPLGWLGHEMEDGLDKVFWMTFHKSLGVTLLLLMALRLGWRLTHPTPAPPAGTRGWEIGLAAATHWALYAVVLGMTLAGWVIADTSRIPWDLWWALPLPDWLPVDSELHEVAEEVHETLAKLLIALLLLHGGAALWHHFIRRDNILRRMWSG